MESILVLTANGLAVEIDTIIAGDHAREHSCAHVAELREMGFERNEIRRVIVTGDAHYAAVAAIEDMIAEGKPFGRKAAQRIAAAFSVKVQIQ